jgi:hypothetical protein
MEQLAIVARLKSGAESKAAALLAKGVPFDPEEHGLKRHTVFLSADEVIFVFEGHEVEWRVDEIITDPFQWPVSAAFESWRDLLDGPPRIARPAFVWDGTETFSGA